MNQRTALLVALVGVSACSTAPRPQSPGLVDLDAIFVEQFNDFDDARVAASSEPFRIVSKDGRWALQGQRDGNVVLVCDGEAVWATHTARPKEPDPPPAPVQPPGGKFR